LSTDRGTSQDIKIKQVCKGHSLSAECRRADKSGHQKKTSKQEAPTDCRAHREGQIRTLEESKQVMGTHSLSSAEGEASQVTERKLVSGGTHFLSNAGTTGQVGTSKEIERVTVTHQLSRGKSGH